MLIEPGGEFCDLAGRIPRPAGFFGPCQPLPAVRPPAGWLHELKHHGYRLHGRKEDECVALWTRHGAKLTDRLTRIA
jgi:ATP-dependent DNA ligase